MFGAGALATGLLKTSSAFAEGMTILDGLTSCLSLMRIRQFSSSLSAFFYIFDINWSCSLISEVPKNYKSYVDAKDGYSYLYPSEWRVGCHVILE